MVGWEQGVGWDPVISSHLGQQERLGAVTFTASSQFYTKSY